MTDELKTDPNVASPGLPQEPRKLHQAVNVAIRRLGGVVPACDGEGCPVCAVLASASVGPLPPPIRAHVEGCRKALSVPVDLCDCGGRDFAPDHFDRFKGPLPAIRRLQEYVQHKHDCVLMRYRSGCWADCNRWSGFHEHPYIDNSKPCTCGYVKATCTCGLVDVLAPLAVDPRGDQETK